MKPNQDIVQALLETNRRVKDFGQNDDWAERWAEYLLKETNFNQLTDRDWRADDLAEALKSLRAAYDRQKPRHTWAHFFALRLLS